MGAGGRIGRIYWVGIMVMGWQWREVKTFLMEAWELFYWSLWCPSKLNNRINQFQKKSIDNENTKGDFKNSLSLRSDFPFLSQFLISVVLLELVSYYFSHEFEPNLWIFLHNSLVIAISSYCIALLSIPVSFVLPILAGIPSINKVLSDNLDQIIQLIIHIKIQEFESNLIVLTVLIFSLLLAAIEPLIIVFAPILILSAIVVFYALGSLAAIFYHLTYMEPNVFSACILAFSLSAIRNKLIGRSFFLALLILMGLSCIRTENNISLFIVPPLLFYFRIIPEFILVSIWCLFLGIVLRYKYYVEKVYDCLIKVLHKILYVTFNWFKQNLDALNVASYERDSEKNDPKYTPITGMNPSDSNAIKAVDLVISNLTNQKISISALNFLAFLPPNTTEIFSLPILNYSYLLVEGFQEDPISALVILENLKIFQERFHRYIFVKYVPEIISNQFLNVKDINKLVDFSHLNHPILSRLASNIYTDFNIGATLEQGQKKINLIEDIIIAGFQTIATDLSSVLNASTITLKERGLDRILQKLQSFQVDLLSLGLKPPSIKRWTSVILHWQHLIELELQEQQKQSQGELLNPFQFGNPLRSTRDDVFRGRRQLADRLYRLILDRDRPTLVLYGARRTGKTSFLLNLSRFLPSDLIPIYLDMQSSAISNSEADFCYGLTRAIHKDTISQGLKLPAPYKRENFKSNPYGKLEDWLDTALPNIQDNRRLLLNLDEFEKIGAAIDRGSLSLRLLDQLRNLIQHYDQLAFMFSGVQTLEELGPNWSSYFISVVPIEMGYLEPHEAEDLLRNPDPDFKMRYADGVIEEILRLTCCQPYLLQLIGSCLVTQANQNQTTIATLDLLQAAIPDAFTNGEPYFTNLWTEFTGTNAIEITAGKQILSAIAQNHPPDLTTAQSQAAHRRLLRFHLLKSNGTEIEIPLFQRWVIERAIDE
jgi:hypothetical protein